MSNSSPSYRNRALSFLAKVFRTQKHLLDTMHRPGDAHRRKVLTNLKNTIGYNEPKYTSENMQRFIRSHFHEISTLIPGEGSGCHTKFTDELLQLRNEAISNEKLTVKN